MLAQSGPVFYSRKPQSRRVQSQSNRIIIIIIFIIIIIIIIIIISTGAFSGSSIGLWEFGTMMCSQCILVMLIQVIADDDDDDGYHWPTRI